MDILFLIGRIIFGGFFLINSYNHFKNSGSMIGYAASKGVVYSKAAVFAGGVVLAIAGLSIIAGVYLSIGLLLVLLYLVPTTFILHQFWKESDKNLRMVEQVNFMKNIALIGATLMMISIPLTWF